MLSRAVNAGVEKDGGGDLVVTLMGWSVPAYLVLQAWNEYFKAKGGTGESKERTGD